MDHDDRTIGQILSRREVLALLELVGNRIEGLPVKRVVTAQRQPSRFITPDGQDAMPPRELVTQTATPNAVSPDDLVILGPELVGHPR